MIFTGCHYLRNSSQAVLRKNWFIFLFLLDLNHFNRNLKVIRTIIQLMNRSYLQYVWKIWIYQAAPISFWNVRNIYSFNSVCAVMHLLLTLSLYELKFWECHSCRNAKSKNVFDELKKYRDLLTQSLIDFFSRFLKLALPCFSSQIPATFSSTIRTLPFFGQDMSANK